MIWPIRFAALSLVSLAACAPATSPAPRVRPSGVAGDHLRDPLGDRPRAPGDAPDTNPDIIGFLDVVDASGRTGGWALSREGGAANLSVELFVDGDASVGQPVGAVTADEPRADVNDATGVAGDHGFSFPLPANLRDGAAHVLRAYAHDGAGAPVELAQSPLDFTLAAPPACASAGPLAAPADDEYVVTLQADNAKYISAECGGDDDGVLRADRDAAGEWETFYVQERAGAVTVRSSHGRFLSSEGAGGDDVHANRAAAGPWESFGLDGSLVDGAVVSLRAADGAHYLSARLDLTPAGVDARATAVGPWERFTVHVLVSPVSQRHGVVRADGRNFVDDDGAFYPLGGTLFWGLYGWQNDRDRVKQNLQFLMQHHYDYVRILGEVDWSGETIDPNAPGYQQALGEFLDYAYDVCGLRTEVTLMGGTVDPMVTAQQVVPVISAGRQHKILDVEVANESYQRPVSLEHMQEVGRYLRQSLPNLVALSSGEGLGSYAPNSTDWRADYQSIYVPADAANLGTIHMDRGQGDGGWREVRQPWDWKELPFPMAHNEPIGPRSSVAEETDPVRLAMLRAVGLINGVGAFVLHNGAGVAGVVDPGHNRPANLWEVPGIDAVMDAVRGVDAFVPQRAGDGQHWNNAWAGNPWVADAFWSDGDDHGVNRNYTVATADGWVSTESGVMGHVVMTAARHSVVEVYDVLLGKVQEVELQGGETLTLTPVSLDSNGDGAFIVIGHYR